jgi:Fic family protein
MLGECQSKCEHIAGVPLRPDVAQILHSVYLAKGAWGTTAIEGNTLSEEEVLKHLQGKLEVPPSKEYLKQEVDNILQESNRMLQQIYEGQTLPLTPARMKEINKIVLKELKLETGVIPGKIKTYSVGVLNYRGAPWKECDHLFSRLCDWLNGPDFEPRQGLGSLHMAILKAVVAHLYIEWIHAFGDGNGRTGRLIEVQILLAAGVPSPACHLLSNHYNLTRNEYLSQLKRASESRGDILPFLTYALGGFLDGLKGQLAYIRKLHMDVAWLNYVHDVFRNEHTKAARRQKSLVLDIFEREDPVTAAEIEHLSPRLARAYAGMHPRTPGRDIEALERRGLLIRNGRAVRANKELIAKFLPIKATIPIPGKA